MHRRRIIAIVWLSTILSILVWHLLIQRPARKIASPLVQLVEAGISDAEVEVLYANRFKFKWPVRLPRKPAKVDIDRITSEIPIYQEILDGNVDVEDLSVLEELNRANKRLKRAFHVVAKTNRISFIVRNGPELTPEEFWGKYAELPDFTQIILDELQKTSI